MFVLKRQNGFTLLEIMLVLFLLGIIIVSEIPNFETSKKNVVEKIDITQINKIEIAIELYYLDTGCYPLEIAELINQPDDLEGWRGPYLEELPLQTYFSENKYVIRSNGKICVE